LTQQNIQHYKLGDRRQLMGYVPQDQFLFAPRVAENIRFGNPDLSLDPVREAATAVHVYEASQERPDRFDPRGGAKGMS
ncbi:multidrug ABC transporter permease/ATP-binding protein, partial [Streptococcus suis]